VWIHDWLLAALKLTVVQSQYRFTIHIISKIEKGMKFVKFLLRVMESMKKRQMAAFRVIEEGRFTTLISWCW
jgi:hypothetical protein